MLAGESLTLWRGTTCLFDELDLAVGPGEALVLRGANGAGKTTLLRVLAGLTQPESGRVTWQGVPIDRDRAAFAAALAYTGHRTGLRDDLALAENLVFAARLRGGDPGAVLALLPALGLERCASLPVRQLSAGQQRRAALARTLGSGATLWMLDEPFTNLDAAGRSLVEARVAAHLDAGGLAVIAAHHELAAPLPGRTLVMAADP